MKFSLILSTIGRTSELIRFFEHLAKQSRADFEVLVVDQNPGNGVKPILDRFSAFVPITHIMSGPGLSRARNAALPRVKGDIVAFPDDDCWYSNDVLERVAGLFAKCSEWDGVTARPADTGGRPVAGWDSSPGFLTGSNVWHRGISWCIFLRRRVIETIGSFDETLGVGSGTPWGSGEETDYLLNAMRAGYRIWYDPGLLVCHPDSTKRFDRAARRKAYSYAAGMGRVLRKQEYPLTAVSYHLLRPVAGVLCSVLTGRIDRGLHRWAMFNGRLKGYMSTL